MSSYAPPTANLPFFNPAVFETEDIALTLSDANKLYAKKSGAIFSGAISAPSLSLNGVNVENKLLEIDANSNKLTDISYNNNVTYILNDLSINGILKLPNLPNVGNDISNNKQKTTKISYDANTSVTTINDTLKASSTLIVGNQNYNASDEFYKLTGISRDTTYPILTITDDVNLSALNLPSHSDVDTILTDFDTILVNMSYTAGGNLLSIDSNVKIPLNFELGTITDVEQKILDVSNAITPYISYDSVNDKIVVGKDVDLGTNDLTCNFMRPLAGGNYGLSKNWTQSYLLFRNGGHHIDSFNTADDTGRDLYLNYYAQSGVFIGSHFNNSTTTINGNLKITETTGTSPIATGGSLTLIHGDTNGSSSIVFKSDNNVNNDYGYISYKDDIDNAGGQKSLLEIGVKNDSVTSTIDNISLMPSGFVGINTRTPQTMLDVNGDTKISGNLELGTITDVEQKIIDISNNAGGGVPSITYDAVTLTTTFDGSFVIIPSDISFELGLIPNLYSYILSLNSRTSWLENTGQGLKINNNTIIEENLGTRTSQLSIRPVDDVENAVQEIYSKNGIATLKLGDDNAGTLTFNNILKSENGNATFYGNNSGETKFMEYNSTDDKINISKDMDLSGVLLEERPFNTNSGSGLCLRTTLNPPGSAGIFEVRSSGNGCRLFCGQTFSSSANNPFYFGYNGNIGEESDSTKYTGKLDTDGLVECTGVTVNGVRFEERNYYPNNGDGISVRPTINPSDTASSGSIFDVRSAGYACRLFVGNYLTSPVYNEFYFGPNEFMSNGEESDPVNYTSNLGTDGSVTCSALTVNGATQCNDDIDVSGNINCTEIQVNSIPLNSFFNFTFGYNYTPSSDFGKGVHIAVDSSSLNDTYSHFVTFDRTDEIFTCKTGYLGTYEIQAHVTYRNTSNSRHNPCIAIGVNDDVVNGVIGATGTAPNWTTALTNSYSQHNIFSAQYVRMGEGKVTTLSSTRIYHFTNTTDEISINTFVEISGGNDFDEQAAAYVIINAGISFKYIGNFDSIT